MSGSVKDKAVSLASGGLRFAALAALVLLVIVMLDLVPGMVDTGGMRAYESVNALKKAPGFESVMVPAFFPEEVRWPPGMVYGQMRPFQATVMAFDRQDGQRNNLVISQSGSRDFVPDEWGRFLTPRQTVTVEIGRSGALLETGLCRGGDTCARLSWSLGDEHVKAIMNAPSILLIRIAESMAP